MLPEFPCPLIFYTVHVIVGNPVWVLVEHFVGQVLHLEFIIGIEDGLHLIVLLHNVEPLEHTLLEILVRLVLRLVLNVEHRRQVASLQMNIRNEESRLLLGTRALAVEMIGTTCEAIFKGLLKIVLKLGVHPVSSLCSLNHHEAHRAVVYHALIAQQFPVYFTLIMGNVNAVNLIAVWIGHVAIERTPTEPIGRDKEIVEEPHIDSHHANAAHPVGPAGHLL